MGSLSPLYTKIRFNRLKLIIKMSNFICPLKPRRPTGRLHFPLEPHRPTRRLLYPLEPHRPTRRLHFPLEPHRPIRRLHLDRRRLTLDSMTLKWLLQALNCWLRWC